MNPEDLLRINGLRVERSRSILDNLDWTIGPNEQWAIMGANGSGKTSLLKAVFGYLTPTAGTIEVAGERFGAADWAVVRNRIGLVSHSLQPRILEDETVEEVILSGKRSQLIYWGDPTAGEIRGVRRILREVDLAGRGKDFWRHLSQGERQRALLGRALHGRRRLLFLDEPCAGLDPVARVRFLRYLEQFAAKPTAPRLVLVTHHIEEIIPSITHVLLLKAGTVLASGPKTEVLRSALVSEAFGERITVRRYAESWRLQIDIDGADGWF